MSDLRRSKASNGGCRWERTDKFREELEELHHTDGAVAGYFEALMEAAGDAQGLGVEDYSAPLGSNFVRQKKPWIAEFGRDTRTGGQCRMYWGEAPEDEMSLIAASIATKPRAASGFSRATSTWKNARVKQDSHIRTAMDRIQAWCRQHEVTYRKLGKR